MLLTLLNVIDSLLLTVFNVIDPLLLNILNVTDPMLLTLLNVILTSKFQILHKDIEINPFYWLYVIFFAIK